MNLAKRQRSKNWMHWHCWAPSSMQGVRLYILQNQWHTMPLSWDPTYYSYIESYPADEESLTDITVSVWHVHYHQCAFFRLLKHKTDPKVGRNIRSAERKGKSLDVWSTQSQKDYQLPLHPSQSQAHKGSGNLDAFLFFLQADGQRTAQPCERMQDAGHPSPRELHWWKM